MLSDEEKKAIERAKFLNNIDTYLEKEMMTNLLNLIEKQQKEIEELKKYEEGYKLLSYSLENYISKDKIKAKIKWYEDFRGSILYEKYNYEEFVKDLQSLLEKE